MQISKFARTAALAAAALATIVAVAGQVDAKGGTSGGGGGGGADAPQNVFVDGNCTVSGTGYVGYNKSGDKVTFVFGAHQDTSTAGWRVTAVDAGKTLVDQTVPALGSDWSMVRNYTSPKGDRLVQVTADALDGSNHCETWLSYRV